MFRCWFTLGGILLGGIFPLAAFGQYPTTPQYPAATPPPRPYEVSSELRGLYQADQRDRQTGSLTPERERARQARVLQMVQANLLASADERYFAAMILHYSRNPRDQLLAHVLATAAAFQGHEGGRWLSAAALDRFLEWNGHGQFFGTQYTRTDGAWTPGPFDDRLTPGLRDTFNVPSLDTLRQRAEAWNRSRR